MFEIVFKNSSGNKTKTIRVIASDFDAALQKCKDAGYDYATYERYGTEDIVSFNKIDYPDIQIIS